MTVSPAAFIIKIPKQGLQLITIFFTKEILQHRLHKIKGSKNWKLPNIRQVQIVFHKATNKIDISIFNGGNA